MIYFLLPDKQERIYFSAFIELKNLIKFNFVSDLVIDFIIGIRNAFEKVFPGIQI